MKKMLVLLLLSGGLSILPTQQTHAVWWVIVKEVLKKVILAIDAQVQQLQNKTIALQNAQKALENALSKLKFEEISEWTEKQRAQYAQYFDELQQVKNWIATFRKVKHISEGQARLVKYYQKVFALLRQDGHFSAAELDYMFRVYSGMIDATLRDIEQVTLAVKAFTTRMSDAERLAIIERVAASIERTSSDMRRFTGENIRLSLQRAKDDAEIDAIREWYGLN
ncbi:MAG: conjugal transfer protein TraI [Agriterribacter sp.]